jgi:hypothetical protein
MSRIVDCFSKSATLQLTPCLKTGYLESSFGKKEKNKD